MGPTPTFLEPVDLAKQIGERFHAVGARPGFADARVALVLASRVGHQPLPPIRCRQGRVSSVGSKGTQAGPPRLATGGHSLAKSRALDNLLGNKIGCTPHDVPLHGHVGEFRWCSSVGFDAGAA